MRETAEEAPTPRPRHIDDQFMNFTYKRFDGLTARMRWSDGIPQVSFSNPRLIFKFRISKSARDLKIFKYALFAARAERSVAHERADGREPQHGRVRGIIRVRG